MKVFTPFEKKGKGKTDEYRMCVCVFFLSFFAKNVYENSCIASRWGGVNKNIFPFINFQIGRMGLSRIYSGWVKVYKVEVGLYRTAR